MSIAIRSASRLVESIRTLEGEGFAVRRSLATRDADAFDPFLLLDEMGPEDLGPGEAKGAPDHPHRGFETVTYILEGRLEHRDSEGNAGTLGPGDVQWMTAGAGVVHSEMPEAEFRRRGGRLHGFQLWVNLPRRDKMMRPRYQEIPAARIPVAKSPDGLATVKVIAGEAFGARAVIETRIPILYLHFTLEPGAHVVQPVPREFNVFAYVFEGGAKLGRGERDERSAAEGELALFAGDGDAVSMAAPAGGGRANLLLIGGLPLREPVVRYGPFVMNTPREIEQAIEDFQNGRMGTIRG